MAEKKGAVVTWIVFALLVAINIFLVDRIGSIESKFETFKKVHEGNAHSRSRRDVVDIKELIQNETDKPLLEKMKRLLPIVLKTYNKTLCQCPGKSLVYVLNETNTKRYNESSEKQYIVRGADGKRGPPGPPGPAGPPGPRGERGLGLIDPKLTSSSLDHTVEENTSQNFSCRFYGNPIPSVEWMVKGNRHHKKTVVHSKVLVKSSSILSTLTFKNISWKDRGSVECHAKSLLGNDSASGKLFVKIKPRIALANHLVKAYMKLKVEFPECKVTAYPEASSIQWSRGYGIIPADRATMKNGSLSIRDVQLKDQGFYICTVVNSMGTTKSVVQLDITPFKITKYPEAVVNATNQTTLSCEAKGHMTTGKWTASDGKDVTLTENIVKDAYRKISVNVSRESTYACQFSDGDMTLEKLVQVKLQTTSFNITKSPDSTERVYRRYRNFYGSKTLTCEATGYTTIGKWINGNGKSLSLTENTVRENFRKISVYVGTGTYTCQFSDGKKILQKIVKVTRN